MGQLSGAIARLKDLREELETPLDFYASHGEGWRRLAESTVRQVLINLRPAGADAESWAQQVELAAARVAVDLLADDEAGILISLGMASVSDPFFATANGDIRLDHVVQWVAAGRQGEPGGKRLDDRDALLSDEKIARNVLFAMKLGKPGTDGLRAALLAHIGGEVAEQAESLYPQILKAWLDVFSVRCAADFRGWVRARIRGAGFAP